MEVVRFIPYEVASWSLALSKFHGFSLNNGIRDWPSCNSSYPPHLLCGLMWAPPPISILKVNFDDFYVGNPSLVGFRCVVTYERLEWVDCACGSWPIQCL